MDQPREQEHADYGGRPAKAAGERSEGQFERGFIEGRIPAFAPEVADRAREQWFLHQGLNGDASAAPARGNEIKKSKVEDQHYSAHGDPASRQRQGEKPALCDGKQYYAAEDFENRGSRTAENKPLEQLFGGHPMPPG